MSTRALVDFKDSKKETVARIYVHCDGYPTGLGVDLQKFLDKCAACENSETFGGTHFDDPYYLAARFVVYKAHQNQESTNEIAKAFNRKSVTINEVDFVGVSIVPIDDDVWPSIAYFYDVICVNESRPKIICYDDFEKRKRVKLPSYKNI